VSDREKSNQEAIVDFLLELFPDGFLLDVRIRPGVSVGACSLCGKTGEVVGFAVIVSPKGAGPLTPRWVSHPSVSCKGCLLEVGEEITEASEEMARRFPQEITVRARNDGALPWPIE
jgi:hypothetical protein